MSIGFKSMQHFNLCFSVLTVFFKSNKSKRSSRSRPNGVYFHNYILHFKEHSLGQEARYFANKEFLYASCPKWCYFAWRSIVWGKEFLKNGLIWRVGDGSEINFWGDKWIVRNGACNSQ